MADLLGTFILKDSPEDNFNLTVDEILYVFKSRWNNNGFWTLDIYDQNKNIIVAGIKLVAGINLCDQYPEINFNILIDTDDDPTRDDLELFPLQFYTKD